MVSNNNMLSKKQAIMLSIENVHCHPRYVGLGVFISTVLETSGVGVI